MEQTCQSTGGRVDPGQVWTFVGITEEAGQRQVLECGFSAVLLSHDMVNLKRNGRELRREMAVLATVARPLPYLLVQAAAHLSSRTGEPFERDSGFGLKQFEQATDMAVVLQFRFLGAGE